MQNTHVWASTNYFDIEIPIQAVKDICHSGSNDMEVSYWHDKIDLSHVSDETLRKAIDEYGLDDESEHKANREAMEQFILWDCAWNIFDGAYGEYEG